MVARKKLRALLRAVTFLGFDAADVSETLWKEFLMPHNFHARHKNKTATHFLVNNWTIPENIPQINSNHQYILNALITPFCFGGFRCSGAGTLYHWVRCSRNLRVCLHPQGSRVGPTGPWRSRHYIPLKRQESHITSYSRRPESLTFIKLLNTKFMTIISVEIFYVQNIFILYPQENPKFGVVCMAVAFNSFRQGKFLSEHPSQYGRTQYEKKMSKSIYRQKMFNMCFTVTHIRVQLTDSNFTIFEVPHNSDAAVATSRFLWY